MGHGQFVDESTGGPNLRSVERSGFNALLALASRFGPSLKLSL